MKHELALFDADGVLVDAERFSDQFKRDFGMTKEKTEPFFSGPFLDCLIGKADLKVEIAPYLQRWGTHDSVDELLRYWFKAEHATIPEVESQIRRLRKDGLVCCLATNQEKYRAEYMRNKMGFGELFDELYVSAYQGCLKNDPEYFHRILKERGIAPNVVIFWDDSQDNIDVAKSLGIDARLVTGTPSLIKELEAI